MGRPEFPSTRSESYRNRVEPTEEHGLGKATTNMTAAGVQRNHLDLISMKVVQKSDRIVGSLEHSTNPLHFPGFKLISPSRPMTHGSLIAPLGERSDSATRRGVLETIK